MTKEQIIELIKSQEAELYDELIETQNTFGANDISTIRVASKWITIVNLLELIENETN